MSCIADLYLSNSTEIPKSGELDDSSPYLQSPSYHIPVLWLALFEANDLVDKQRADEDEPIPYLVKRRVDALSTLDRRAASLTQALPGLKPEWITQFVAVLQSSELEYVHMDTSDIGQMAGSWEAWKENLAAMLEPLMDAEPMNLLSWAEDVLPEESRGMSWSYCGNGGDEPLPWEDEA